MIVTKNIHYYSRLHVVNIFSRFWPFLFLGVDTRQVLNHMFFLRFVPCSFFWGINHIFFGGFRTYGMGYEPLFFVPSLNDKHIVRCSEWNVGFPNAYARARIPDKHSPQNELVCRHVQFVSQVGSLSRETIFSCWWHTSRITVEWF